MSTVFLALAGVWLSLAIYSLTEGRWIGATVSFLLVAIFFTLARLFAK